jgi:hypothetical protein
VRVSVELDRFGLTLSTPSAAAAESYRNFVDAMLSSSDGVEAHLAAAEAADDRFALAASGDLVRLGGSNAQREVFEDTLIVAFVKSGDRRTALSLLDQRLARRPSRVDDRWRVQATT